MGKQPEKKWPEESQYDFEKMFTFQQQNSAAGYSFDSKKREAQKASNKKEADKTGDKSNEGEKGKDESLENSGPHFPNVNPVYESLTREDAMAYLARDFE